VKISVEVNTARLEDALYLLAKAARLEPGRIIQEEVKGICRQIISLTPPRSLAQGRNAIKGDLFGGRRVSSARYSSIGLFQRIGNSTQVPPRGTGTETVGVRLGWEGGKKIRIMKKFWQPNAGIPQMRDFHKRYQNPRTGRTGVVSQSQIGRWRVQDQMWVSDGAANKYLRDVQSRVGWAKAAWVAALESAGGTAPSWIKRHAAKSGSAVANYGENPSVLAIAHAVKIPNYQRMVDAAVATRVRITERKISRLVTGKAVNLGFMVVEAR
jgi:hypothetical protein